MQWNDSIIAFHSAHKFVSCIQTNTKFYLNHHTCYERYSTYMNSSAASLLISMPWNNADGKLRKTWNVSEKSSVNARTASIRGKSFWSNYNCTVTLGSYPGISRFVSCELPPFTSYLSLELFPILSTRTCIRNWERPLFACDQWR